MNSVVLYSCIYHTCYSVWKWLDIWTDIQFPIACSSLYSCIWYICDYVYVYTIHINVSEYHIQFLIGNPYFTRSIIFAGWLCYPPSILIGVNRILGKVPACSPHLHCAFRLGDNEESTGHVDKLPTRKIVMKFTTINLNRLYTNENSLVLLYQRCSEPVIPCELKTTLGMRLDCLVLNILNDSRPVK